jgi:hypothetical protein
MQLDKRVWDHAYVFTSHSQFILSRWLCQTRKALVIRCTKSLARFLPFRLCSLYDSQASVFVSGRFARALHQKDGEADDGFLEQPTQAR